eukprot:5938579-Pyramimonas_sp.AAC.1
MQLDPAPAAAAGAGSSCMPEPLGRGSGRLISLHSEARRALGGPSRENCPMKRRSCSTQNDMPRGCRRRCGWGSNRRQP